MTYVCITGNESNPEELRLRIEKVLRAPAPMLAELRLDYLNLSPQDSFRFLLSLPEDWSSRLVLTQRLSVSGPLAQGRCRWDIPTWQNWWREVMQLRSWYAVDLDWLVLDELAGESLSWPVNFRSKHVLFSLHGELNEIERRLPDMLASVDLHKVGAKIAAPVKGAQDLARLARIKLKMAGLPLQVVAAMGKAGRIWRWSRLAGNITYFVMDEAHSTAQGQDTLERVLPYLKQRHFPDLYMLWSTDPLNLRGEQEWNRSFLNRGLQARYFNVACGSEDFDPSLREAEKKLWAADALFWMEQAQVKGASVTRPFKEVFPLELAAAPCSINTLTQSQAGGWLAQNTDGSAVLELLRERGIEKVILLGSGGTAQGLSQSFTQAGLAFEIWSRDKEGSLPPLREQPAAVALVSTWPSEYQDFLVKELERHQLVSRARPILCVDAQLKLNANESPLALWCGRAGISYLSGPIWWKRQAQSQELAWGLNHISATKLEQLLALLPRSKSETIRALWIALSRGGSTELIHPGDGRDIQIAKTIVQSLGLKISEKHTSWILEAPPALHLPSETLDVGDCGAVARILMAWSAVLPQGNLKIQASPDLQRRPMKDYFESRNVAWDSEWPLKLKCDHALPELVSMQSSSQFATGFLLAASAKAVVTGQPQGFTLSEQKKSLPYLSMTVEMLRQAGFRVTVSAVAVAVEATAAIKAPCKLSISLDASALAFAEIIFRKLRWSVSLPWDQLGLQGDAVFPHLLEEMRQGKALSLADCPDIAPPLWVAALLERSELRIIEVPQLRFKESDRAKALVDAAQALGAKAELSTDGFYLDARGWQVPLQELYLPTFNDHRLAMAYGLLELFHPQILPQEKGCVIKSFPKYWHFLKAIEEMMV